jgi:hypothetical protein
VTWPSFFNPSIVDVDQTDPVYRLAYNDDVWQTPMRVNLRRRGDTDAYGQTPDQLAVFQGAGDEHI